MYKQRYKDWSENRYFDEATRNELRELIDASEIEDRFYTDLEFGTGGMRGIIGAGTNRINIYVIRKATQGLAEYILETGVENASRGVVIAYDSRRYSKEFALEAALVLAKNSIKTYLFNELRPTPELSYAVRHLRAIAGIVITASHNPKEYNGFKVYWEDGGQVPPERSDKILEFIRRHESVIGIIPAEEEEAKKSGLLIELNHDIDIYYLSNIKSLALNKSLIFEKGHNLKIIYTPLHGTGIKLVPRVLNELGFNSVIVVKEQENPDPDFPTVTYPNPELEEAFDLAKGYGISVKADLILATDPDADRLGVMVRSKDDTYSQLTGNQLGVLLEYYILIRKKALGVLRSDAAIIKTIASTDLADKIAQSMGVAIHNVLTGFKYIAEKINKMEKEGSSNFQFGFEESNGYLAGQFVRDKDAVIASVLIADAALYFKETYDKSLLDILEDIYQKYGYYLEDQISFTLKGKEGQERISGIMNWLRNNPQNEFGGLEVEKIEDYALRIERNLSRNLASNIKLPTSNVIRFTFCEGGFVMARPSGTEPKIKFYFLVKGNSLHEVKHQIEAVKEAFLSPLKDKFGLEP